MKRLVIIISLLLILTAFTKPTENTKTIPREKIQKTIALVYHNNLYFIRVKLNNRNANLLVDTGAVTSLLDINQANDYDFQYNETDYTFIGIGGITSRYRITNYQFNHDEATLNVRPHGADLTHIAKSFYQKGIPIVGILGSDFLKNNDAIIDYKNKQLIIHY